MFHVSWLRMVNYGYRWLAMVFVSGGGEADATYEHMFERTYKHYKHMLESLLSSIRFTMCFRKVLFGEKTSVWRKLFVGDLLDKSDFHG